jgi:hypothetical protein
MAEDFHPIIEGFKLLFQWLGWVTEKAIEGGSALIEDLNKTLLKKKEEILQRIADWLDEGNRGLKLLLITLISGGVIVVVEAFKFMTEQKLSLKSFFNTIKDLDFIARTKMYWTTIKTTWELISALDPQFKTLQLSLVKFADSFSEVFGLPANFLFSLFSSYYAYVRALYNIVGLPDVDAKLSWLENVKDAIALARHRFKDYALSPENWFKLIEELPLLVDGEQAAMISRDTIANVAKLLGDMEGLESKYTALSTSVSGMISAFPDEIEDRVFGATKDLIKQIDDVVKPALHVIAEETAALRTDLLKSINDGDKILAERLDALAPWVRSLLRAIGFDLSSPAAQALYLKRLFGQDILRSDSFDAVDSAIFDAYHRNYDKKYEPREKEDPGAVDLLRIPELPEIVVGVRNEWFCGENDTIGANAPAWYVGE